VRCAVAAAALLSALAGCSSGAKGKDAAAGAGGVDNVGTAGVGGGSGGAAGTTSAGAGGAGGDGSGLPACAITARPQDPTNAGADGGMIESASGACNSIVSTGPLVNRGCFDRQGDGGIADGGIIQGPAGGTIRDGDYEVVSADTSLTTGTCPPNYSSGMTRRTIRIFGGGTYFEWAASNRGGGNADVDLWYDTTMRAAGHTLTFVAFDCGDNQQIASYGYTATADEFTYFAYANNADGAGVLQFIVRYRRTCWR
jgi:hypothetical protein